MKRPKERLIIKVYPEDIETYNELKEYYHHLNQSATGDDLFNHLLRVYKEAMRLRDVAQC